MALTDEQATIEGTWETPRRLPVVIFHDQPDTTRLPKANRPWCDHCLMIEHGAAAGARDDVPSWFRKLKATHVITQVDGSTLTLCEQHAQDHAQRGDTGE